ncbi:MAG: ABC transporter ATP-binding protein [Roseitalea sp.]|jgi:peptide/nickel transport system ATP-binding protein|nr:ABC transporter ATP-binding protein [Roseitalea sp.]MBO6741500.1 ABC transporter ATP-binding protein [Roseitalea sp.]
MTDLLTVEKLRIDIRTHGRSLPVVKDVSFRIPPGKTVAIVGESGSGKTVMARSLLGILPNVASITGGSIWFRDPLTPDAPLDIAAPDLDEKRLHALRGGRISMIFQEPMSSFSPLHTIGNQIHEAWALHNEGSHAEGREIAEETLALVGFADPRRGYDSYPMEFSGGMLQRAMIAMAVVCSPALLIADEPTTALDVVVQAQVLALLKSLQERLGMALLLITHDLGVVANMADEVVVVYRGSIMEAGSRDAIFNQPRHPYLKALLGAVPKLGPDGDRKLRPLREIEPVDAAGSSRETGRRHLRKGKPLLTVSNLVKTYATKKGGGMFGAHKAVATAVDRISFRIVGGECFGIVGESGCGKSSLIRTVTRAISADAGQITFHDEDGDIDVLSLRDGDLKDFRTRMQMVFQDPFGSLSPRLTILNTLVEPLEIHGIGTPKSRRDRAAELMRLVGLPPNYLNRYPHSFSGGQRQRVGIARALALEPDILICDEAVSALDVSVQAQILNLLKHLQKELGLTIIFISHNLAVVNYIADRIAVMRAGRIVELAPRRQMFTEAAHPYTRRLLSAIPTTDLGAPLDLDALGNTDMSDPADWPQTADGPDANWIEISDGHFVRPDGLPS